MSIKFIDGNIFSRLSASKPTYICQQVNCKGAVLDIISDAAKAWNVNVEIWKL